MAKEHDKVTEANRQLSPAEREERGEQLPEGDDETTRANERMSRVLNDDRERVVRPTPPLPGPPD